MKKLSRLWLSYFLGALFFISPIIVSQAQNVRDSLKGHWMLNSALDTVDRSGNNNRCFADGGTLPDRFNNPQSARNVRGWGKEIYSILNNNGFTNAMTFSFWMQPAIEIKDTLQSDISVPVSRRFTNGRAIFSEYKDHWIIDYFNGQLRCFLNLPGGGQNVYTLDTAFNAEEWYHMAFVNDPTSGKFYFYINNQQFEVGAAANSLVALNRKLSIGTNDNSVYPSHCAYDDIRVYNKALTSTEINSAFQETMISTTGIPDQNMNQGTDSTVLISDLNSYFSTVANQSRTISYSITASFQDFINVSLTGNTISAKPTTNFFGKSEVIVTANDGFYSIQDTFLIQMTPTVNEPDSMLIAHYTFEGGTAVDITNQQPSLNPGSNSVHPPSTRDHFGIPGEAFHFGYNNLLSTNGYNNAGVNNGYSVSTWVKPKINFDGSISSRIAYMHYITSMLHFDRGTVKLDIYDGGGTKRVYKVDTVLMADTWYHIAVSVLPNEKVRIFINGEMFEAGNAPASLRQVSQTLHLGGDWYIAPRNTLTGDIDELRTYKKALTPLEVATLYQKTIAPPQQLGTVADTTITEDSDTTTLRALASLYNQPDNRQLFYHASADSGIIALFTADTLSVVPIADFNGTSNVYLQVTDSATFLYDTLQVTVSPVNDQPVLAIAADSVILENIHGDSIINFSVTQPVDEQSNDQLQYTISPDPQSIAFVNMTLDSTQKSLTITPVPFEVGRQVFTLTVSDGTLSHTDTFTIATSQTYFEVSHTSPVLNGQNIAIDSNIGIKFPEGITAADSSHISLEGSQTGVVPFTLNLVNNDSLIITPSRSFFPNEWVTVKIQGIKSSSNKLLTPYGFQYLTGVNTDSINGNVRFSETILSTDLQQPRRITPIDLDQDGDLDMVVPFYGSNTLAWFENKGDLTFERKVISNNESGVINAKAADIDQDGDIDIFGYNHQANELFWMENDGAESFTKHSIDSNYVNSRGILAVDIDEDGDIDIIQSNAGQSKITAWLNNGQQQFTDSTLATGLPTPFRLHLHDFNQDGKLDIIFLSLNTGEPRWLRNNGGMNFTHLPADPGNRKFNRATYEISICDYNKDGKLDVWGAMDDRFSNYLYYLGSTSNTTKLLSSINFNTRTVRDDYTRTIATGDIDGDGSLDIFSGSYQLTNQVYWGRAPQSATNSYLFANSNEGNQITSSISGLFASAIADFDNDGDLDIAATGLINHQVTIYDNKIINLRPEVIAPIADKNIEEDESIAPILLSSVFSSNFPLSYTAVSDTNAITINISNDTLTIAIEPNYNGNNKVTITATATDGKMATDEFEINITPVNDHPTYIYHTDTLLLLEDQEPFVVLWDSLFMDVEGTKLTYSLPLRKPTFAEVKTVSRNDSTMLVITPKKDAHGHYYLTLGAYDNNHRTDKSVLLKINSVNDTPTFTLSDTATVQRQNFTDEVKFVANLDTPPANESGEKVQFSISPSTISFANMTLDNLQGIVRFTAVSDSSGSQVFTLTANDGGSENNTYAQNFSFTVASNLPPEITDTIPDLNINEGFGKQLVYAGISKLFEDPEGDTMQFSTYANDSLVTVSISNDSLYIEAGADYYGAVTVTVEAFDGRSKGYENTLVTISNINDQPQLSLQDSLGKPLTEIRLAEDYGTFSLSPTISQPANEQGETLSYSFNLRNRPILKLKAKEREEEIIEIENSDVSDVTYDQSNNQIVFTAIQDQNGEQILTIIVNDGGTTMNTDTLEIPLIITPVNDAPTITPVADQTVAEDFTDTLKIALQGNQPANEGDLEDFTFSTDQDSLINIAYDQTTKALWLTAKENAFGTATINVQVSDGEYTATDTFEVQISAVNDQPAFTLDKDSITLVNISETTETVTVSLMQPANESTQNVTYSISPSNLSFAQVTFDSSTGQASFTSIIGETGTQVMTIIADDAQGENNTFSKTFTVKSIANQPPTVTQTIDTTKLDEDFGNHTLVADISNLFSDPDGDTLSYAVSTKNDLVNVTLNGVAVTLTAKENLFGTEEIILSASDGNSSTQLIAMVVISPVNDAPTVTMSIGEINGTEDSLFSYQLPADLFADVENDSLTIRVLNLPTWLTYDTSTQTLSGTPSDEQVGKDTITVQASDETATVSTSFSIAIENINDLPVALGIPQINLTEDTSTVSIDLSAYFSDADNDNLTYTASVGRIKIELGQRVDKVIEEKEEISSEILDYEIEGAILKITPKANANGSKILVISAADSVGKASSQATINIAAVNDAPSFSLAEKDFSLKDNFDAFDINIVADSVPQDELEQVVTYSINPSNSSLATVTFSDGKLTVTAKQDATGTETFTITADDGQAENNISTQSFTLTVTPSVLAINELSGKDITTYPNPFEDQINIQLPSKAQATITLFNVHGVNLRKVVATQANLTIDTYNLPSGIYFLQIETYGKTIVKRLVK